MVLFLWDEVKEGFLSSVYTEQRDHGIAKD